MQFPLSDDAISSIARPKNMDWETFVRSLSRRLGLRTQSKGQLLSGEEIEKYCDFTLMKNGTFTDTDALALKNYTQHNFFLKSDKLSELNLATGGICESAESRTLFLHNSDISHPQEILVDALKIFNRIFVTNWLGAYPQIYAMPIGLENQIYLRNGIQNDYLKLRKSGLVGFSERPISLLNSFNLSTNVDERRSALNAVNDIGGSIQLPVGVPPRNYRYLVANSKYVLSPPGNGPDCHRTWEALYLGAVPIVKRSSWPRFDFDVPVVVVDNWSDVNEVVQSGFLPKNSGYEWQSDFWRLVNDA